MRSVLNDLTDSDHAKRVMAFATKGDLEGMDRAIADFVAHVAPRYFTGEPAAHKLHLPTSIVPIEQFADGRLKAVKVSYDNGIELVFEIKRNRGGRMTGVLLRGQS